VVLLNTCVLFCLRIVITAYHVHGVAVMFGRVEWRKLRPLIARKLELVIGGFQKTNPGTNSVAGVNSDSVSFDEMRSRLLSCIDKFNR